MTMQVDEDDPTIDGRSRPRFVTELATLVLAVSIYFGVRVVVEGGPPASDRNADRILDFEEALGIDIERTMQDVALESDLVRELGNFSYVWLHWPLLILAVAWVFFRNPARYVQLRNALFVSGGLGLLFFWLFPVSPPRFMPGFTGTVSPEARKHFLDIPVSWSNQYAAFPSFHVGWTLIACLAVAATLRTPRARMLALLPAVLVAVSVISTGNHYLSDATVGAVIALVAYAYFDPSRRTPAEPAVEHEDTASPLRRE